MPTDVNNFAFPIPVALENLCSHDGGSAKRSYKYTYTTAKGCGLIINCPLCRARQFFPVFLGGGKWKMDVRFGLPYLAAGF